MKIGDSDFLNERVVKSETKSDRFLDIAYSSVSVDYGWGKIFAVDSVNELFFLTVCTVKKLEYFLHCCFVVTLRIKFSVLIKVFRNLSPRDPSAVSLGNLLFATESDISLGDMWNNKGLVIWSLQRVWRKF